jgi:deoxycytidylate deaminase
VFADRDTRERRLTNKASGKFQKAENHQVRIALDRDEDDKSKDHGQKVRKTFFLGDFFINNTEHHSDTADDFVFDSSLNRFTKMLVGESLHRPTPEEAAMYHAFGAAMQSTCLSRQVGAVLTNSDGQIVSTGINEVPKYGGGVYDSSSLTSDRRCFAWQYERGELQFTGCHKDRKNSELRDQIAEWIKSSFLKVPLSNLNEEARGVIEKHLDNSASDISEMPGVGDLIEYSRSIHAEMDALLTAGRNGISTTNKKLFCTTYPCHNCARHLVSAGITEVQYIEPYVKSQAIDLHSDSIADNFATASGSTVDGDLKISTKMVVRAFSGVGPRMYEDHFLKRGELKDEHGKFVPPEHKSLVSAAALNSIEESEEKFRSHLMS